MASKFGPANATGRSTVRGSRRRTADAGITLEFRGGRELAQALRELGEFANTRTARNALNRGLINAAQPMVDAAKSLVPIEDGELLDSITASTSLSRRQKKQFGSSRGGPADVVAQVFVGPSTPKGAHGILVEFGTDERVQRTTGKSTGRTEPQPFMRPAFEQTSGTVLAGFAPSVAVEIERARKRIYRKQQRAMKKGPRP